MATSVNMNGKGTGRKGSTVYKIVHGVQVQQEYNPHVSNPNTTKQQNTRSRFKLMSQLAAVMAPYAVYKREGLTSPRNVFIRENFKNTVAEEGNSAAAIMNFQFAKGVFAAPVTMQLDRDEVNMTVSATIPEGLDVAMCSIFVREADGSLSRYASGIMTETDTELRNFEFQAPVTPKEAFAYVYAMKFNNATAKTNYEDYIVGGSTEVATLIKENVISVADMSFSKTKGAHIASVETAAYTVQVYSQNPNAGTVAVTRNSQTGQATLTATPRTGYMFAGWRRSGSQDTVATQNPYSFLPLKDETFWGLFISQTPEV